MGMSETIIGIDPGVNGGIVALWPSGNLSITKMPVTERDLLECLQSHKAVTDCDETIYTFLEWIHPSIQGVGKASMSKLYGNYKQLRMALVASGIPFEEVRAAKWQRAMGISKRSKTETTTQWKNRLKARAQELFPPSSGIKVTLWSADALLIAEHGRRLRSYPPHP